MIELKIFDNNLNDELIYIVGENAQDNWNLIDASSQNDLWFHLENHPSSHVVLKMPNIKNAEKKISKQSIIHCAVECKNYSKLKNTKKVSVIYTEIKNVTKADKPGSVYTKKIRVIKV
jgi:predicted ribosome quality control (RQC) complex YloA/Tae2 family protein